MLRGCLGLAALCGALASGWAPAAPATSGERPPACFEDWWSERVAAARSLRTGPEALLPLRQVMESAPTAADPELVHRALDELRALADAHPLTAGELDWFLLDADVNRGAAAAAEARAARLGLVRRMLVAGPFKTDEPAPAGLFAELAQPPAERRLWREIATGPDGLLPLHQIMNPSARVSAVVVVHVRVSRRTAVALRFGADDRARVELDGAPLGSDPGRHGLAFDQHATFAELAPGFHRIAVWVEQDDGPWGVALRLTTPEGRPLDPAQVAVVPLADAAAAETELIRMPAPFRPARGQAMTALLERLAQSGRPRAKAGLALDLAARALPDRADSRAVRLAREAAAAAPNDADVLWVQAVVDSDPAQRRGVLEQMLATWPMHPAALRRLVNHDLQHGRSDAALAEAERALASCRRPDPQLQGWAALARDGRGFPAGAAAAIAPLVGQHPHQSLLLEQLAALYRRAQLPTRARRAYEQFLDQSQRSAGARAELIGLLAGSGDSGGVQRRLKQAIELDPLDLGWRVRLIRALLAEDRSEAALSQLREALAQAPGHPRLLELEGEVLLASGRVPAAASAWRAALSAAQDPGTLGDRLAALTGADDSFGAEWTVTLEQAQAIEAQQPVIGDPPAVALSKTAAFQVRADGLGTRFEQLILRIRHPDQAGFARRIAFSYSPTLERASVLAARLVRADGAETLAQRSERPMLPDPEMRMWYDARVVELAFPRLEAGDLLDIRWRISDRGPSNPVGEGYFGEFWLAGAEAPVLAPRLILDAPVDRPLQRQLVNLPAPPNVEERTADGRTVTVVELPPLPADQNEPLAPPPTSRLAYAVVGAVPDWATLGRIYADLIRDQAVASADVQDLARSVASTALTRRQKVRALYNWVIDSTRYVALEFGIHNIKPYDAPSVLRRRFGDCKDKATLLATLLREVGVPAQVALVRTRERGPFDPTVPVFAAFDHAIVYVPDEGLWLDGTALHHALGELPAPDRDALALLVDPRGGGQLTRTPLGRPEDDQLRRDEDIGLNAEGAATIDVRIVARGERAALERSYARGVDQPGVTLAHRLRREFPDLTVTEANFEAVGLADDDVRYGYRARMTGFARRLDGAMSAPLALSPPSLPLDQPAADRRTPIELPPASLERVNARLRIPPGFTVRELPPSDLIETPWGRLELTVRQSRPYVEATMELMIRGGVVPADQAPAWAEFVERARHALEGRIVLAPAR